MLQYFSRIVFGQDIPDNHLLGRFEPRNAWDARKLRRLARSVRDRALRCGYDNRARPLSGPIVGQPDDGDLGDAGMAGQDVLDFLGRDVLAVADDDVFGASGDDEVLIVDPTCQISGAEVSVGVERSGFVFGCW